MGPGRLAARRTTAVPRSRPLPGDGALLRRRPDLFAFSTTIAPLLALDPTFREPDDLYLAQVLISWPGGLADRTVHRHVKVVPPAHCLTVRPEGTHLQRYWRMEEVDELRLGSRAEYVEGFREVFREAVEARLPAAGRVGITLSGGLDSSAVASAAAAARRSDLGSLVGLTAVPVFDTTAYVGKRFGHEWALASATAEAIGPIDLVPVRATTWTPVGAIRKALDIHGEPIHAAANLFWLLDIVDTARRLGCSALLTGQMGNAGISWTGDPLSQPIGSQFRALGLRGMMRAWMRRTVPPRLLRARARWTVDPAWHRASAIAPDLARRLDLLERRIADPAERSPRTALEARLAILMPVRDGVSATFSDCVEASGLDLRDPTADVRVIRFVLAIPDRQFMDPGTGFDRMIVREAMKGSVPDVVRLNRRRGRQAGDLVPRLRASAAEVDAVLDELGTGPAAGYIDLANMRDAWRAVQAEDTADAFRKAVSVLTRGIMVGLCVNGLAGGDQSLRQTGAGVGVGASASTL